MPFIAICPYCQKGRVHAPERALGMTAPCPKCQMSFTLVNSGETLEEAKKRSGHRPRPDVSRKPGAPVPQPRAVASSSPSLGDPETPTVVADTTDFSQPRLSIPDLPLPALDEPAAVDPVRAPTLIAFILAGVALVLAQVPHGRFGTVGLALVGLLIACACWLSARRPLLPATAAILNFAVLTVAFLLPSWLGLTSWRSKPPDKEANAVRTFGREGLATPTDNWVPGDQGWQVVDVRAVVRTISLAPIELTGPSGEKRLAKKPYLQIRVRIGNVGVARLIEFKGWDESTVRLTDSTGRSIPLASFEPGWQAGPRVTPASLPPGRTAEQLFVFEPPAGKFDSLRLELPGGAFDMGQPVRFQIAASQITRPQ